MDGLQWEKSKAVKAKKLARVEETRVKFIAAFLENTFNLTFNVQISQAYIK